MPSPRAIKSVESGRPLDASSCDPAAAVGAAASAAAMATVYGTGPVRQRDRSRPGAPTRTHRRDWTLGKVPAVALYLPGSPDHALAAWFRAVLPLLSRPSDGAAPRRKVTLPLARKIGIHCRHCEIVLRSRNTIRGWPLAVGYLPLHAIARADAWRSSAATRDLRRASRRCFSDAE